MGLFTQEPKTDYSVPLFERLAVQNEKSQRQFTDMYLDPAIKENIGYESPRMKMKTLTQGVDLTDGKKVQETFLALQAIDPQQAIGWLESIKPVIAQQLDSLKIKSAQLKFTKSKNKPLITQRWNLEGRPNFITEHATTALAGLEGHADLVASLAITPNDQKEFIINSFLNKISKENDGKARIADYKKKLKEANTNYMEFWGGKDLTEKTTEPGTGSKRTTKLIPTPPPGADDDSTNLYKVNPKQSQIRQGFGKISSDMELWKALQGVQGDLTGFMPEFLMTDAELEIEDKRDAIGDWIDEGEAAIHFKKYPSSEFYKFKQDPIKYWDTVINKKIK
jgi:hypothetical protein